MKKLVLALLFAAAPLALGDGGHTVLLNGVTSPGPSSAIYNAGAEAGYEMWFFFKRGDGMAELQASFDNGSTWKPIYAFHEGSDLRLIPSCGGCQFRVYVTSADAAHTVSSGVTVSGAITPTVAP